MCIHFLLFVGRDHRLLGFDCRWCFLFIFQEGVHCLSLALQLQFLLGIGVADDIFDGCRGSM